MQTEKSEPVRSVIADTRGKHRISAELKRLEQETRHLEEELDQLEKMEAASAACKEILNNVETRPDPLLPTPKSAEEMEAVVPKTTPTTDADPAGTKTHDIQVPRDEQGFQQPKKRRRAKKTQVATGIQIPKPTVKYVPKKPERPANSKDTCTPQQDIPSSSVPVVSTGNQYAALIALYTDDASSPSMVQLDQDPDTHYDKPTVPAVVGFEEESDSDEVEAIIGDSDPFI